MARRVRPAAITVGGSLTLSIHDVAGVRAVADDVGASVIFDAAHLSGLIAGRVWPNPLVAGADVMTMSTYKSLGGPPSGLLATNEPGLAERLDAIAFPGITANFDVADHGGGTECARRPAQAGLLTSAIGLPSGTCAGLRLGVNEMIPLGASLDQVDEVAELAERTLPASAPELEQMASEVADLRARFSGFLRTAGSSNRASEFDV